MHGAVNALKLELWTSAQTNEGFSRSCAAALAASCPWCWPWSPGAAGPATDASSATGPPRTPPPRTTCTPSTKSARPFRGVPWAGPGACVEARGPLWRTRSRSRRPPPSPRTVWSRSPAPRRAYPRITLRADPPSPPRITTQSSISWSETEDGWRRFARTTFFGAQSFPFLFFCACAASDIRNGGTFCSAKLVLKRWGAWPQNIIVVVVFQSFIK